jgi:hypothetical protein
LRLLTAQLSWLVLHAVEFVTFLVALRTDIGELLLEDVGRRSLAHLLALLAGDDKHFVLNNAEQVLHEFGTRWITEEVGDPLFRFLVCRTSKR